MGLDAIDQRGLVLVGRPGCHLCEDARQVVSRLAAEFEVVFRELSIATEPVLADRYFELIPVVIFNGRVVAYWWVDESELRAAMQRVAER